MQISYTGPVRLEDVAATYESDWTATTWIIWIAVALVAAAVLWFSTELIPYVGQLLNNPGLLLLAVFLPMAALLVVLLGLPFTMARHIPAHDDTWWVLVPAGILGLALLLKSYAIDRYDNHYTRWVPRSAGVAVLAATIIGWAADSFTRAAAAVPMGVTTLAGIIVVGAIVFGLYASSQRSN